jgi:hypothetical protein
VRRTRNCAPGNGLGTAIKNLVNSRLATTIKYLRGAAGIGLDTTINYIAQCLNVQSELPPCVRKQHPQQHTAAFCSAAQKVFLYEKNKITRNT